MSALRAGDAPPGGETRTNHYRPSPNRGDGRFRRAVATRLPRPATSARARFSAASLAVSASRRWARSSWTARAMPRARRSVPARRRGLRPSSSRRRSACRDLGLEPGDLGLLLGHSRGHRLGELDLLRGSRDGRRAVGAGEVGPVVGPQAPHLCDHAFEKDGGGDAGHDGVRAGRGEGDGRSDDDRRHDTAHGTHQQQHGDDGSARTSGAANGGGRGLGRGSGRHAASVRAPGSDSTVPRRAALTSGWRNGRRTSARWSLTMPVACIRAYAVVGPTNRKPRA